jgi:hypothetical protein
MAPKQVFLSYSHEDESLKVEFLKHFSILERSGIANVWHDRKLCVGDILEAEISQKIRDADLFVFLISASFIHSEFCWSKEMHEAIRLSDSGNLIIVGVVVREVDFSGAPFERKLLLPKDAKAVTGPSWKNHDEAWTNVISEIRKACLTPTRDVAHPYENKVPSSTISVQSGFYDSTGKGIRVEVVQPELVRPEDWLRWLGYSESNSWESLSVPIHVTCRSTLIRT